MATKSSNPRWNSEATNKLKQIFLELMVDDPPEEGELHPLMFDKDWKRRIFIEHFESMGYVNDQWYRNYPKCLEGFTKECKLSGRRQGIHINKTPIDDSISFKDQIPEKKQKIEKVIEQHVHKKEPAVPAKQKPTEVFLSMASTSDYHLPVNVVNTSSVGGMGELTPEEGRYVYELPRGFDYDSMDVDVGVGPKEFIVSLNVNKDWNSPEQLYSHKRVRNGDSNVWQSSFKEANKHNMKRVIKMVIETPFRIESLAVGGYKRYHNKKRARAHAREIERIRGEREQASIFLKNSDACWDVKFKPHEKYLLDRDNYSYFVEVVVQHLDYKDF